MIGFKRVYSMFVIYFIIILFFSIALTRPSIAYALCSEEGSFLICEDWDTDNPPTNPWPVKYGPIWHGWMPADYNVCEPGDIVSTPYHSGQRCLMLYRAPGLQDGVDVTHSISGNPQVIFVRFYLLIPTEDIGSIGKVHFLFVTVTSYQESGLDFRIRSNEFIGNGNGENGSGYEWYDHVMLAPISVGGIEEYVVETEGTPFFWEEHTNEWVLVEWKLDYANDRTSLWINENLYIRDYHLDFTPDFADKIVISSFEVSTFGEEYGATHYYIDDFVVSTSYIGPRKPPTDTTPPTVSNILSQPSTHSAAITWTTNEPATSQVEYGTQITYGSITPFDSNLVTNHSVNIVDLNPNTEYHYRIRSRDASGNECISPDHFFITGVPDITAPASVSNFEAAADGNSVTIRWTNPSDTDFKGTMILYNTYDFPKDYKDGTELCDKPALPGSEDSYIHTNVPAGVTHYYAAFPYDDSNNCFGPPGKPAGLRVISISP